MLDLADGLRPIAAGPRAPAPAGAQPAGQRAAPRRRGRRAAAHRAARGRAGRVELEVRDFGPGVDPAQLERADRALLPHRQRAPARHRRRRPGHVPVPAGGRGARRHARACATRSRGWPSASCCLAPELARAAARVFAEHAAEVREVGEARGQRDVGDRPRRVGRVLQVADAGLPGAGAGCSRSACRRRRQRRCAGGACCSCSACAMPSIDSAGSRRCCATCWRMRSLQRLALRARRVLAGQLHQRQPHQLHDQLARAARRRLAHVGQLVVGVAHGLQRHARDAAGAADAARHQARPAAGRARPAASLGSITIRWSLRSGLATA